MNAPTRKSLLGLAALALAACAPVPGAQPSPASRPALLVMISVDQLRDDLLERYDAYWTGGFRRLRSQGAVYTALHDHAGSETGPGHATLSTGVVPARSGIVGNDWTERVGEERVTVYNVQDTLAPIVGVPRQQGMSPRNLQRTGLADWLREAYPAARVVSIGGKDRSAILMAGKARGHVYWYDTELGRFITSTYYAQAYPEWVERYNTRVVPTLLEAEWVEQSPVAARALARPDTAAYEADGTHTFFPHRHAVEAPTRSVASWAGSTPAPDRAVLGLAREAIAAEGLGRDDVPDFLALGLSQADRVGHRFGPLSREQLDNLIRLDRELGAFFDHLDRTVGAGRWVAALSADHGATTMPEWLAAQGQPARRATAQERQQLAAVAAEAAKGAAPGRAAEAVAAALRKLPIVADAYTVDEIVRGTPRDSFVALYRRSYHPERAANDLAHRYGVEVRPKEGIYLGSATGTGHGGPYVSDRVVPLIFLGGGIPATRGPGVARTVDLAPTLARLAGIGAPADLDGRALLQPGGR